GVQRRPRRGVERDLLGDHLSDQIALGDDSGEMSVLFDEERADLVVTHHFCGFADRGQRSYFLNFTVNELLQRHLLLLKAMTQMISKCLSAVNPTGRDGRSAPVILLRKTGSKANHFRLHFTAARRPIALTLN